MGNAMGRSCGAVVFTLGMFLHESHDPCPGHSAPSRRRWASYRISEERRKELALLQERLGRDEAITAHYQARYRLGASELKDYLEALNSEDSTRQSLLQAKYALLRDESTV